jgi:hypothetical protein
MSQLERERMAFEDIVRSESEPTGKNWSERVHLAKLLMRHATSHAHIQEAICNGVEWTQWDTNESFNKRQARHETWTEKRDAQLEKRIRAIVAELGEGFGVVFLGDPRGCTVKIVLPSGRTNDWGREGYCVPTRS